MQNNNFTPEMEETLRESLKRCSPETIEAAIEFRKTGDISKINTVVLGVLASLISASCSKIRLTIWSWRKI